MNATRTATRAHTPSVDHQVPMLSDHSFSSSSGPENNMLVEEVAPDPAKDPVGCFREQVLKTWIPKWQEDTFNAAEWFKDAEALGVMTCKMYTPEQLEALDQRDALLWKEECHYRDVLSSITLPLKPERTFSGKGEGPVIFVRCPDRNNAVIVVNGNHRTGAIMLEEYNPQKHPLYVVEFASPECFEKFAGSPLSAYLYIGIDVRDGPRK